MVLHYILRHEFTHLASIPVSSVQRGGLGGRGINLIN